MMKFGRLLAAGGLLGAVLAGGTGVAEAQDVLTGDVVVNKVVVNDDGGTLVAADFTAQLTRISDGSVTDGACDGTDGVCIDANLEIGVFQIGEDGPDGFTSSVSCSSLLQGDLFVDLDLVDAEFALGLDDTVTCTITNDDSFGDVRVIKEVVNDDGGTAVEADFTAQLTRTSDGTTTDGACDGTDGLCIDANLAIGDFRIGEDGPDGFTSSVSCSTESLLGVVTDLFVDVDLVDAEFTLGSDATVTCTITNDDSFGDVVVIKEVVNDDGGTLVEADFTAQVIRTSDGTTTDGACDGTDGLCIDANLAIGEGFRIGETGGDSGLFTSSVSCTSDSLLGDLFVDVDLDDPTAVFDLETGETVTCTITNDDTAPTTSSTTTTMVPSSSTTTMAPSASTTTMAPTSSTTTPTTLAPATPTTLAPATPTTLAPPTTAFNAGLVTLPRTGSSSTTTSWMAMTAVMLIAAGGAMLLARRRSA